MQKYLVATLILLLFLGCSNGSLSLWPQSYLTPLDRAATRPAKTETALSLRVTPGEYEPALCALRSVRGGSASVSLVPSTQGQGLPSEWCELCTVVSRADSTPLNRLAPLDGPLAVGPDTTGFIWLTVRPPEDAPAGTYSATLKVECGPAKAELPVVCEVLPFRLTQSPLTAGVFMASTDLPAAWYADMKAHGLDAVQMFWGSTGIGVQNVDGKLVLDFSGQDSLMSHLDAAGMDGPVVISLGNDHSLHYETALARAFGLPVDTSEVIDGKAIFGPPVSPKLDELFMEGLRQIRAHWDERGWRQELVVLIYDEPTERLLERCKSRYDLLKKVTPETRVYGVVMNRRAWAESMTDQCDIFVSDGDFTGCMEAAQQMGKDFWVYSFPLGAVHTARYDMGALPWRVEAQGTFFWMYNYWSYDPDGCAVYRDDSDPSRPVRSIAWEGVREAVDDLRYFATAERAIARARGDRKAVASESLMALRESVEPTRRQRVARGEDHDEVSVLDQYNEPQRIRNELISIILSLQKQP